MSSSMQQDFIGIRTRTHDASYEPVTDGHSATAARKPIPERADQTPDFYITPMRGLWSKPVLCAPAVAQFHPKFEGEHSGRGQGPPTSRPHERTCGFTAPCHKDTTTNIHAPSPVEFRPYGIAVSVANHYTVWATSKILIFTTTPVLSECTVENAAENTATTGQRLG
ncbi:hypothetical protein TNCV_3752581 [Trichonephila clavipes]|nr:hypothetical protein TNCV_3752581 [Trichonephila clavipes]